MNLFLFDILFQVVHEPLKSPGLKTCLKNFKLPFFEKFKIPPVGELI